MMFETDSCNVGKGILVSSILLHYGFGGGGFLVWCFGGGLLQDFVE